MEQTDAEAERHVFVFVCFFWFVFFKDFWKPLQTSPKTSVHYPYVHVIFEHRASLRDSSTFALENCDCPCRPKPRRWAAKLSIQLTTRGLRSPCSYQSCQQSAFLPSPPPSLHKTQLYTFLCLDRFPRDKLKIICYGF